MIDSIQATPDTNNGAELLERFELPDSMAGLLETALEDSRGLDRKLYFPNYAQWHNSSIRNCCEVCLAGSIIARSFQVPPNSDVHPSAFSDFTFRKLEALESMRVGDWWHAFVCIYNHTPNDAANKLILALSIPKQSDFLGWDNFETHLESLQGFIPRLREIDKSRRTFLIAQSRETSS